MDLYNNEDDEEDNAKSNMEGTDDENDYDWMDPNELTEIIAERTQRNQEEIVPINEPTQIDKGQGNKNKQLMQQQLLILEDKWNFQSGFARGTMFTLIHMLNMDFRWQKWLQNMCAFNEINKNTSHTHQSIIQDFTLDAGLKQFGPKGHEAAVHKM